MFKKAFTYNLSQSAIKLVYSVLPIAQVHVDRSDIFQYWHSNVISRQCHNVKGRVGNVQLGAWRKKQKSKQHLTLYEKYASVKVI